MSDPIPQRHDRAWSTSATSDRTIAHAAKEWRRVAITTASGVIVTGYVVGNDNFHWALITPDLDTVLVHKTAPIVLIEPVTVETEQHADRIKSIMASYRTWVMQRHLGHQSVT